MRQTPGSRSCAICGNLITDLAEACSCIDFGICWIRDDALALLRQEHFVKWSARPLPNIRLTWRDHKSSSPRVKLTWSGTSTLPLPRSIRPETYIQFGGRAILEQLTRKLPALMTLPSRLPPSALEALCWRPFCQILDHVRALWMSDVIARPFVCRRLSASPGDRRNSHRSIPSFECSRPSDASNHCEKFNRMALSGGLERLPRNPYSAWWMIDLLRVVCG